MLNVLGRDSTLKIIVFSNASSDKGIIDTFQMETLKETPECSDGRKWKILPNFFAVKEGQKNWAEYTWWYEIMQFF